MFNSPFQTAKTAVVFETVTYASQNPDVFTQAVWRSDGMASATHRLEPEAALGHQILKTPLHGLTLLYGYDSAADLVDSFGVAHSGIVLEATDGATSGSLVLTGKFYDGVVGEVVVGAKMYFWTADGSGAGSALWVTDATASGIQNLGTFGQYREFGGVEASESRDVGGVLYFFSSNPNGLAKPTLWTSDGTKAGTHFVTDMAIGATGSQGPSVVFGDKILMSTITNDNNVFTTAYSLLDPRTGAVSAPPAGLADATIMAARLVPAVNDFNADLYSDVLFCNPTGALSTWQVTDTTLGGGGGIGDPGAGWTFEGDGDFNGDGESDLLFEDTSGAYATWNLNDVGGGTIGAPGGAGRLVGAA